MQNPIKIHKFKHERYNSLLKRLVDVVVDLAYYREKLKSYRLNHQV